MTVGKWMLYSLAFGFLILGRPAHGSPAYPIINGTFRGEFPLFSYRPKPPVQTTRAGAIGALILENMLKDSPYVEGPKITYELRLKTDMKATLLPRYVLSLQYGESTISTNLVADGKSKAYFSARSKNKKEKDFFRDFSSHVYALTQLNAEGELVLAIHRIVDNFAFLEIGILVPADDVGVGDRILSAIIKSSNPQFEAVISFEEIQ